MNILVVDDNVLVLEGFSVGIDAEALGFTGVYTATSSTEAKKILEKVPVHAVIADIEMPGGSGLDLLEWINGFNPMIVTVFCTSYGDFNYAKRALELHAFDYYLKPVDYRELTKKLKAVVAEVQKRWTREQLTEYGKIWLDCRRQSIEAFWTQAVCSGIEYADAELLRMAEDWKMDYTQESPFSMICMNFTTIGTRQKTLTPGMDAFVLKNITEEIFGQSEEKYSVEALLKGKEASWTAILRLKEGTCEEAAFEEQCRQLIQSYGEAVGSRMQICYEWQIPFLQAMRDYQELNEANVWPREKESIVSLEHIRKVTQRENDYAKMEAAVRKVIDYVKEHYGEMITREDLGEAACLNPVYLARIFKARTGKTMGNYILDVKVEKAKEMLKGADMTVSEVSLVVGYDNFSYFSKLFKDRTGVSPKEYRKKESV